MAKEYKSHEKPGITENDDSAEKLPSKFSLSGDNTGSGAIDYDILDKESWQTLQRYCQKWDIKQAHLKSIHDRFERTISRTEHEDFTPKPQYHVSLDFLAVPLLGVGTVLRLERDAWSMVIRLSDFRCRVRKASTSKRDVLRHAHPLTPAYYAILRNFHHQDEFMATAGDFAAQLFIQTWFLQPKMGLRPPNDRRSVDFARMVIMSCDLARLGDLELLSNFWACVLHRFGCLFPDKALDLDLRLNTDLVREVITVIHTNPNKDINLLINILLEHSEPGRDNQKQKARNVGDKIEEQEGPHPTTRYLSLRQILRFSFQHPPTLLPAVQFQRALRRKIIGSRYWLRRRQRASDRGVNLRSSLGLHHAYDDLFDRIESPRDAWVIAAGHVLLHALETSASTSKTGGERDDELDKRYEQLLDNCLRPARYLRRGTAKKTPFKLKPPMAGGIPAFPSSSTAQAKDAIATRATTLRSRIDTRIHSTGGISAIDSVGAAESTDNITTGGHCTAPPNPAQPSTGNGFRGANLEGYGNASPMDGTESDSSQRARGQKPAPNSNRHQGHIINWKISPSAGTPCAYCLTRLSPFVMCGKCGQRAARAMKDARGSRQVRVLLERYGEPFGLEFPDALETEGDVVRRWVQLYDDQTGAHFFYNVHYDCSVWKGAIDLPERETARNGLRGRKGGPGILGGSSNNASGRRKHSLRLKMSPTLDGAGRTTTPPISSSALARSISRESTECFTTPPRVRDRDTETEVVIDAHRRLHPPLRLVSREDSEAAAKDRNPQSKRSTPG